LKQKIFLFGANGMLGQKVSELLLHENLPFAASSVELKSILSLNDYVPVDITDFNEVERILLSKKPTTIINCSAYTAVDKAEIESGLCNLINNLAVKKIAEISKKIDAHFIHISTDYVFDGNSGPYNENDNTNPLGVYGLTKLKGEEAIIHSGCNFTIFRTNVLYGSTKYGRSDFVKWLVDSLKNKKEVKIVKDQINNPTFINDLANLILKATLNNVYGLFNSGGPEFLSRFDFSKRIAEYFNLEQNLISPITTEELNQAAKRPLKSGLKLDLVKKMFDYNPTIPEEAFEIINQQLKLDEKN